MQSLLYKYLMDANYLGLIWMIKIEIKAQFGYNINICYEAFLSCICMTCQHDSAMTELILKEDCGYQRDLILLH